MKSEAGGERIFETITVLQPRHYGCLARIFCCRCIHCCQDLDFSLLTSHHRKTTFQRMVKRYLKRLRATRSVESVVDPFFILVALLLGEESEDYGQLMAMVTDQSEATVLSKEDLQFYIPELCTYLVFHEELRNVELENLLVRACKVDVHFSLKYYFHMRSLEVHAVAQEVRKYQRVANYNSQFRSMITHYQNHRTDHARTRPESAHSQPSREDSIVMEEEEKDNGIRESSFGLQQSAASNGMGKLDKLYMPLFQKASPPPRGLFQSTVGFYSDLIELGKRLVSSENRREELLGYLQEINQRLPAAVYIPFTKDCYTDLNVVSIVADESRVFNTKERAPYYLCLEAYRAPSRSEALPRDKKIRSRAQIRKNAEQSPDHDELRESQIVIREPQAEKGWNNLFSLAKIKRKILNQKTEGEEETENESKTEKVEQGSTALVGAHPSAEELFGESTGAQMGRVRSHSEMGELEGWTLVHLMVKSLDDLRQESFAMQLLQEFEHIFRLEKELKVKLLPYEVLPLSHEAGIMECVRDALTIDELKKKGGSLLGVLDCREKVGNFIATLAGYSLVTYLLQVKDRHNANILIRQDGSLCHIDYGFFMSNAPGKGVELEKALPFKLTNDYVQALGGLHSKNFTEFRKQFYLGFQALRKHQHRILILTKLMYSSYGSTMPCFTRGNEAIQALEERFNPPGETDAQVSAFCQNLVNCSMDNWRSRWYDKWQYYAQGVFY